MEPLAVGSVLDPQLAFALLALGLGSLLVRVPLGGEREDHRREFVGVDSLREAPVEAVAVDAVPLLRDAVLVTDPVEAALDGLVLGIDTALQQRVERQGGRASRVGVGLALPAAIQAIGADVAPVRAVRVVPVAGNLEQLGLGQQPVHPTLDGLVDPFGERQLLVAQIGIFFVVVGRSLLFGEGRWHLCAGDDQRNGKQPEEERKQRDP